MAVDDSSLTALAARGGIGLMNAEPRRSDSGNAYTSLGGGARLVGGADAKMSCLPMGPTGGKGGHLSPPHRIGAPAGSIVVLDIENIKANNLASVNTAGGSDWQAIREGGQAAVSSAMLTPEYQRWAALIAMDSRGQVPMGNVEPELNKLDQSFQGAGLMEMPLAGIPEVPPPGVIDCRRPGRH